MSYNRFGQRWVVMTFGESHGSAIGGVIDGVPPGVPIALDEIQHHLDRRRPGQSSLVSQRQEPDKVEILSGVFANQTTGTPIGLLIKNTDARSRDYQKLAEQFRPGHADITYQQKYQLRDYRGGGRASARETAVRVAAGAIARQVLAHILPATVTIEGALIEMGNDPISPEALNQQQPWLEKTDNIMFCPDSQAQQRWQTRLKAIRKQGDSLGGVVLVRAFGFPAGLGEPVYGKLDAELASAMMGINAVKAVAIGDGFASARRTGRENADEILGIDQFSQNAAGGILGGISTGQPITVTIAVKPTSSILQPLRSIDSTGQPTTVQTGGRHDPCVAIRAVPVAEAMMACVLLDHVLRHRGQCGTLREI